MSTGEVGRIFSVRVASTLRRSFWIRFIGVGARGGELKPSESEVHG